MNKTVTIKSSRDFTRTFHRGKSFGDKFIVVYFLPNRLQINRTGISIGKKVGGSVVRNRVKRLIRESYREVKGRLKPGFDILFIPRPASAEASYSNILSSLNYIFKRLDLFNKEVIK